VQAQRSRAEDLGVKLARTGRSGAGMRPPSTRVRRSPSFVCKRLAYLREPVDNAEVFQIIPLIGGFECRRKIVVFELE
jgi:hypothetical protein